MAVFGNQPCILFVCFCAVKAAFAVFADFVWVDNRYGVKLADIVGNVFKVIAGCFHADMQFTVETVKPGFEAFKAIDAVVKQGLLTLTVWTIAAASKVFCDISKPTAFLIISLTMQIHTFMCSLMLLNFQTTKKRPLSSFLQSDDLGRFKMGVFRFG